MNIERMTNAYKMLYEIETILREITERKMNDYYGPLWKRKFNVGGRDYYHDTVARFGKYPPLINIFSQTERQLLYNIIPIRNQICHMHLITHEQYQLLNACHKLINEQKVLA